MSFIRSWHFCGLVWGTCAAISLSAAPAANPGVSVVQHAGAWWFAGPDGKPFFSRGVCCVAPGLSREEYDAENPAYAAWRQHASLQPWADSTLARLRAWDFTTLGGWADLTALRASTNQSLWLTPVLHLGSSVGVPWYDLWDETILSRMDALAREQITVLRNHPRLLGYYSDNELGWWNAALFNATLQQPATSGQRQRLLRLLHTRYGDDWTRLTADFESEHADSWPAFERGGVLHLRPGGQGIRVLREFLSLLAERYYQVVHQMIRRYDSRALILGDRYQSFFYPEVARAAAPYVDVISSNLNVQWDDGSFLRCYLDTLHALTQKPILVSEFYMAAQENRSGNRNSWGVFPVVRSQADRARAAAHTLELVAQHPFVVGADWFQWSDEPQHGRTDGENFNFGLVDLNDQPYSELTAALAAVRLRPGERPPRRPLDVRTGIPLAPAHPWQGLEAGRALLDWDRERGFVPAHTSMPLSDLYICWDAEHLYLGLYSLDIVEEAFYRDRHIPKSARALWSVSVNGRPVLQARLGAGREPIVNDPAIRVENLSGWNLNVRNIALAELPFARFSETPLRAGQSIELACSLSTHANAERVEWRGTFTLSDSRPATRPTSPAP